MTRRRRILETFVAGLIGGGVGLVFCFACGIPLDWSFVVWSTPGGAAFWTYREERRIQREQALRLAPARTVL